MNSLISPPAPTTTTATPTTPPPLPSLGKLRNRASIAEIAWFLLKSKIRWRHPVYLIHAVTSKCNASCGFCAWDFYEHDDLSTEEAKQLYQDARDAGFFALSLWGGEPLVRKDIGELTSFGKRLGFRTHMVTNGFLLGRKMNEVVPHLDRICISVDHPSDKHDEMRGLKGLYGRIIDATREIKSKDAKKPVIFVYTLQKENVAPSTIREMAEVMQSVGAVGIFNAMRVDAAADEPSVVDLKQYNPSGDELSAAFEEVYALKEEGYPILNTRTHLKKMAAGQPEYRCHWPKFMLPVEANGDVVDCMHWGTKPLGNLRNTPFADILQSPRLAALAGKTGEACHKCVSQHRIDVSEAWEGNWDVLRSWASNLT